MVVTGHPITGVSDQRHYSSLKPKKVRHVTTLLFFLTGCLVKPLTSVGQQNQAQSSFGYSLAKQRLQLKLTTSFVYFSMQGQLDMDSAAILVSEGESLPYHLYYDEDYANGPESNIKEWLKKGNAYLFKSGSDKKDLERALSFLLSARQEALNTKNMYFLQAALASLGRYYLQSNEMEKSKRCFTEAVDLARKTNSPRLLFHALANRGSNAAFNDNQKEVDLNEALQLSRKLKDTVGEIEILTRIYEIYFVSRKLDTVKKQLLHVTELEKSIGFRHIHYNHRVLAYLNYHLAGWGEVFAECKAAVDIMEANRDFAFSNFIYGAMAQIYSDFEDHQKALYWLHKSITQESLNKAKRTWYRQFTLTSLEIAKTGNVQQALDFVLKTIRQYPPLRRNDRMNIAHILGYCYDHLNQKELCEKHYRVMEPYLDSLKNDPAEKGNIFSAYMDLARHQLAGGNVGSTERYFRQARLFVDSSDLFNMARVHWMQYKLDSSAGNYLKALREYRLTETLDDSIYNLGKAKQFAELQVQYETETKDKDITLLKQKEKVQEAVLRQSDFTKKVTLAGIFIMLAVTLLVFQLYRNKQRRNKEVNQKNVVLEQLIKDKEWLIREIHHRVKNNFHIVASLLEIQSSFLKNKEALSAIRESQHRIHSMSIIHQKLYQSETLSTIHMPEYIYELVEYLRDSYSIRKNIAFVLQVDNIHLNQASAITLGLILNEGITNAIKYAFAKNEDGKISISLSSISESHLLLSIADNGQGLPIDFDAGIGASMGMELLQGLTDDLGGRLSINTQGGTHIKVIFDCRHAYSVQHQ
jgi:two-component sensor histidine kinase